MKCNYLFRPPFFCDQWSLYLLHRALTYFGSIFNGIIMIILDVGIWYDFIWIELPKGTKSTGTFEMLFSCFGPFWVWGMTCIMFEHLQDHLELIWHYIHFVLLNNGSFMCKSRYSYEHFNLQKRKLYLHKNKKWTTLILQNLWFAVRGRARGGRGGGGWELPPLAYPKNTLSFIANTYLKTPTYFFFSFNRNSNLDQRSFFSCEKFHVTISSTQSHLMII